MFDQLRWDYLSCYGHPHLKTPNIDRLAAHGRAVRPRLHPVADLRLVAHVDLYRALRALATARRGNDIPLKVGEMTMGDHLREAGMECWLVGKTHMAADAEGMERLGIEPDSVIGARVAECGFDVFERDDGMRAGGTRRLLRRARRAEIQRISRGQGLRGRQPLARLCQFRHRRGRQCALRLVPEAQFRSSQHPRGSDSETPYLTRRGMEFIERRRKRPWLLPSELYQAALALHRARALP